MSNRKFIIGLADQCQTEVNSMGRNYANAVLRGGHIPFILPYTLDEEVCRAMLEHIDVLLLCGGGDIAAVHFGEPQSPLAGEPNDERDRFELQLMRLAIEMKKPVAGVCRGLQLINVALGGSLYQDIGEELKALHQRPDSPWGPVHEVILDETSRLYGVFGEQRLQVNSTHHQAINRLGDTLRVVAQTDDGVVEAIESTEYPIAAVQWHPERLFTQDVLWREIKKWTAL